MEGGKAPIYMISRVALCYVMFYPLPLTFSASGTFSLFFFKKNFSLLIPQFGPEQVRSRMRCVSVGVGGLNSSTLANANASAGGCCVIAIFLFWFHSQNLCYSDLANGRTFVITEFERIL